MRPNEMSGTFPLYDNLFREASEQDLGKQERDDFMKLVKKIDVDGSELFYAVTKCYQLNHVLYSDIISMPYGCKVVKGCIRFELDKMPVKLRRMLYNFLIKHVQKMDEDIVRPEIK
jgi:hypothetical protein